MSALPVILENIPSDLRERDQWTLFLYGIRRGKKTKIPFQAWMSERKTAKINDPSTWSSFGAAITVLELCRRTRYDGLLFAVTKEDPFTFIDLDRCRDALTGKITDWALDIIRRVNSYCEVSPSGTGIHCFVRGKLPPGRRKIEDVEMYDCGRFATMTGKRLEVAI